jgi:hypothetical protein
MEKIKIMKLARPEQFEDYLEGHLVDIAYIEEVHKDTITISLDPALMIRTPEDIDWVYQVLLKAFETCHENEADLTGIYLDR